MTWLLLRTTGILALGLLTVGVASGIAGPGIRNPTWRLVSVSVHRTAGVSGTVLLAAHVLFAVLDSWVDVSWAAAFLPGASAWEPLWIGMGAMAVDLMLVIMVTSAARRSWARLWWNLHVASYVAYALAWLHAAGVGSDAMSAPMIGFAAVSAAVVCAAVLVRRSAPGAPAGPGLAASSVTRAAVAP